MTPAIRAQIDQIREACDRLAALSIGRSLRRCAGLARRMEDECATNLMDQEE